jgi:hypothetical protein
VVSVKLLPVVVVVSDKNYCVLLSSALPFLIRPFTFILGCFFQKYRLFICDYYVLRGAAALQSV